MVQQYTPLVFSFLPLIYLNVDMSVGSMSCRESLLTTTAALVPRQIVSASSAVKSVAAVVAVEVVPTALPVISSVVSSAFEVIESASLRRAAAIAIAEAATVTTAVAVAEPAVPIETP